MREIVIVSAARTPIGNFQGAFKNVSAVQLGIAAANASIERARIDREQIDEVIIGNVLSAGLGQNVARQVSLGCGISNTVPAMTLGMVCGSGLRAISLAAQIIKAGDADIILAGGTENMSQSPYLLEKHRLGAKMGNDTLVDSMIRDGLWDVYNDYHMGVTAENVANRYRISREEQDVFALQSQQRAQIAIEQERFVEEIAPVAVPQRKGNAIVVDHDEYPRFNSAIEGLLRLQASFQKDGSVTAGNASGINDGAAMILVCAKEKADELGLPILVKIKGYGSAGVDPSVMGLGVIPATKKALKMADLKSSDLDLVEANEAFAAQALAVTRELELAADITNVNGGAIALGHPIGASGARILTTLLYEMKRRESQYGLATLCIGGGMGTALIVERD
ncbi:MULTISPECIES: acetyl-CoA C-acetyltransferase [unclassified Enterococcus]|uniref:acetyl-CoA C-acetyltransferase n=1 Tax=unclassified Enterococcus TaxID=2608891 RepID=UPI000A33FE8C|nr:MULTISPECIES: acetyl-CoA C-acetyltransferase [unclassified Enterococcus]OTO72798.1 hypothetical protein A5865_001753 [Enterococcus sp. 12E11_DIV0728]OUZ14254.1 hypothetical protein A5868_003277 [Enterococcus sp. 12F9_DIV0723]